MDIGALFGTHLDMPLWCLLLFSLLVGYYWYMTMHFNCFKNMDLQGPHPTPIFGNLGQIKNEGLRDFMLGNARKYGKIYGMFLGRTPFLCIADHEMLQQIMVKEFPNFVDRIKANLNDKNSLFSLSVNNLRGDHWRHVRNTLSPTFSNAKLKLVLPQIIECADQMVNAIEDCRNTDEPIEYKEISGCFAMDVIAYTTYGIHLNSQKESNNAVIRMIKKILETNLTSWRVMILYNIERFFLRITHQALQRHEYPSETKKAADYIGLMAASKVHVPKTLSAQRPDIRKNDRGILWSTKGLSVNEIAGNSLIFTFAGYDTTSSTLAFAMYCLATNPTCQSRLIEEIDSNLKSQEAEGAITYSDVVSLQYMQQVIDETLRLYPPASRLERLAKNSSIVSGIHIPAGMHIAIPVIALHMDAEVWPQPEVFDPDRFSKQNVATRHSSSFMPFGIGPRSCVAKRLALLELKVALVRVLQSYRLLPCEKTQIPLKLTKNRIHPEKGIWLKAQRRHDS